MENQNIFNRKSLKFFRSTLRNKSTSAEAELWNILKSKKLGFSVLRFENKIVFQDPEFVKNEIRKAFKKEYLESK